MSESSSVFDPFAEDYDRWFDSPEGKVLFSAEVRAVRLIMKNIKKPFLEVGIGTGRFAEKLGIEFGIDPSAKALQLAESRGIKVRQAKGEKLPFKAESFGTVFLLFTLCFVEDPEKVLSEVKRVLNKGGGLIIGFINRETPWGQLYMKKKAEGHRIYKYASFYSIDEVAGLIENAGMTVQAYSSALCRAPSEMPRKEVVHIGLAEGAGFVCILARRVKETVKEWKGG